MLTNEQIESAIKPIEWSQELIGHTPIGIVRIWENDSFQWWFKISTWLEHNTYGHFSSLINAKFYAEKTYRETIMRCFNVE